MFPAPASCRIAVLLPVWLLWPGIVWSAAPQAAAERGKQIYLDQCAACHGKNGEGVEDHFPDALRGDKTVAQLAAQIAETMPEGEPEACVGEDAQAVAAHMYDAFYSPLAQARNRPPRVALARLTARQYRNSVADVLGSFRGDPAWNGERGLEAEYFNSERFNKFHRAVLKRRDPVVDFDFGGESPDQRLKKDAFGIRWQGSLFAPETGEYEIAVHSPNGFKLWLNDEQTPRIDRWVRSGDETVHRARVHLLGGRRYRLKLELFKDRDKAVRVALKWTLPHQTEQVIAERFLSPQWAPPVFVLAAPLPPDDRSAGYERGIGVSLGWEEATTAAALEVADHVAGRLHLVARPDDAQRDEKLRAFCERFVSTAFRRPLTDHQRQVYIDGAFAEAAGEKAAVGRCVLLTLKSPWFLYPDLAAAAANAQGADASPAIAARLALALWDSLPDERLRKAADQGSLNDPQTLRREAERMAADPRATARLLDFLYGWLHVQHAPDLSKADEAFPDFDPRLATDLRMSLDAGLRDVVESERCDFRELLRSRRIFATPAMAAYYGLAMPSAAEDGNAPPLRPEQLAEFELPGERRAGVLGHPYLMANFAYAAETSPIHRGVFVARNVLGRALRPPPVAVAPAPPDLHPDMTTRERVTMQTSPDACQSCHTMINALGFAWENFDATGRWREKDNGKPVNASADYMEPSGEVRHFTTPGTFAAYLAESEEVHRAFATQLFHNMVQQPILAYGPETPERLTRRFRDADFNIRRLMVEIAALASGNQRSRESFSVQPAIPLRTR